MNKKLLTFTVLISIICLYGCRLKELDDNINYDNTDETAITNEQNNTDNDILNENNLNNIEYEETDTAEEITTHNIINKEGKSLNQRINTPKGYERTSSEDNSFLDYMRDLSLKDDGSPVMLHSGSEKGSQDYHVAIFDFDVGDRDLQQCADSIIRVYAEYFLSRKQYDKINFHLTNGFLMEYTKWMDGNRLKIDGNNVSWVKSSTYDDSYNSFRKFLDMTFAYAGTLSLSQESRKITTQELKAGDMFIQGGSPGHCVLVVDTAVNEEGEICFLLAQGYMPAQDFHVVINPLHEEDPWYYISEFEYPLITPQWNFDEGSLKRWLE